jgi:hypothetical protein
VSLNWLPILYCGKEEESSLLVCVASNKREKQREKKRERKKLEAERSQIVPR